MAIDLTDPIVLMVAVLAVLLHGVSKGGFGGGAGFAATALLAMVVPPEAAVGVMLPLLMLMDATGLPAYWQRWSWRDARAMMIGALPGIALGTFFFAVTPVDATRLLIGVIAIAFVLYRVARESGLVRTDPHPYSVVGAGFWGSVAGFTSFASHAGGAPATIYLLGRALDKTTFQATTMILFWWINIVKVPPYWALGMFDDGAFISVAALAPVALIGVLLGIWAHSRVPERTFFAVIQIALSITGVKLVYDGATGLLGAG